MGGARLPWSVALARILFPPIFALFALFLSTALSLADSSLVSVDVVKPNGWIGERIPILVELRTRGTFSGATSFDLPEVPGALLIKIGNPVIGSREIDGESFFVQTHELALFSQRVGQVEIPSFPVRLATRVGFTGPITEYQARVPSVRIELKRPPGTQELGYLVTTEELALVEEWSFNSESVKVGDTIRRTVSQRAAAVPGMVLAPLPDITPAGVRVYTTTPEISDRTERGAFEGQRKDILTYLIQKPGEYTLPALVYYWWHPTANRLESKTFPALTLQVPFPDNSEEVEAGATTSPRWMAVSILCALIAIVFWQRRLLARWFHQFRSMINSPEQAQFRNLIKACRQNDAQTAYAVWHQLICLGEADTMESQNITAAISDLERHLYGTLVSQWSGEVLARALWQRRRRFPLIDWLRKQRPYDRVPPLNP